MWSDLFWADSIQCCSTQCCSNRSYSLRSYSIRTHSIWFRPIQPLLVSLYRCMLFECVFSLSDMMSVGSICFGLIWGRSSLLGFESTWFNVDMIEFTVIWFDFIRFEWMWADWFGLARFHSIWFDFIRSDVVQVESIWFVVSWVDSVRAALILFESTPIASNRTLVESCWCYSAFATFDSIWFDLRCFDVGWVYLSRLESVWSFVMRCSLSRYALVWFHLAQTGPNKFGINIMPEMLALVSTDSSCITGDVHFVGFGGDLWVAT